MGGSSHNTHDVKLNHVPIQSSALGIPLTVGWGMSRATCNVLDIVGFKAKAHKTQTGGKGGGGSTNTSYTYTATVLLGLCEGTIKGVPTIWRDSSVFTDGGGNAPNAGLAGKLGFLSLGGGSSSTTALAQAQLNLATGGIDQAPWSYLVSQFPTHALNYSGIAYVYAANYPLTDSGSVPNHSFEINFGSNVAGKVDANPRDIITDALTSQAYGVPGWGAGLMGDLTDYSNSCLANNLLLSPVIDTQRLASDFISEVCAATNAEPFWSEGVLKIASYGDTPSTGNGVTWTPNMSPQFDLTEADFIPDGNGNPVNLNIVDQSNAYNICQIEFLDRANQYNSAIASTRDLANIEQYGPRQQDSVTLHSICDAQIAMHVVQLMLQRALYCRENYTFTLPWDFVQLEPMDLVTLTTTTDGLLLNRELVRIIDIAEDDAGMLAFTAEGVDIGVAHAALNAPHSASSAAYNRDIVPGSVSVPVLFNPPSALTTVDHEIWLAAASLSPTWGGCQVWISTNNVDYAIAGTIDAPARYGTLTAGLPQALDPDDVNTCSVDLSLSLGALAGGNAAGTNAGATPTWVDGEVIAYETATLTGTNRYDLTMLRRGLDGTTPAAHLTGASAVRLDDAIFKFAYKDLAVGATLYVKLPSFNIYGRAIEDISIIPTYGIVLGTNNNIEIGADVTADAVPKLTSLSGNLITIQQDSSGVPIAGQYPLNLSQVRTKGSFDVSASQTLAVGNFTGTCTSGNVTVSGSVVTVASPAVGSFTVTSTKGTETVLTQIIQIVPHVAAAATPVSTSVFNNITSTSDNNVTAELSMVATATTMTGTAASIGFRANGGGGNSNIKLKWVITTTSGSGYSDVGSFVTGSAETAATPGDPSTGVGGSPGGDGVITCNQQKTGLTIGVTYYWKLVGQSIGTPDLGFPEVLFGTAGISCP